MEAHRKRIAHAVRVICLPRGAAHDDREEARECAAAALGERAPVGSTDRRIREVMGDAIRPVIGRINQREADEERRTLEGLLGIHRTLIPGALPPIWCNARRGRRSRAACTRSS